MNNINNPFIEHFEIISNQLKKVMDSKESITKYLNISIYNMNLNVPIIKLVKGNGKKTILISAGVHGDEFCGVNIISKVEFYLNSNDFNGQIYLLPTVNIWGLNNMKRFGPSWDLNREFNDHNFNKIKNKDIDYNSHILLNTIFIYSSIAKKCDLIIDLHSDNYRSECILHVMWDPNKKLNKLVENLDFYLYPKKPAEGTIRHWCSLNKLNYIIFECGAGLSSYNFINDKATNNILNLLSAEKILKEFIFKPSVMNWITSVNYHMYFKTAMITYDVKLEEEVKKGQKLYTIKNFYDSYTENGYVEENGLVYEMLKNNIIAQDIPYVCGIAIIKKEKISNG